MIKKAFDFLISDSVILGVWLMYLVMILASSGATQYQHSEYLLAFADWFAAAFLAFKFWCDWRHKV